MSIRDERHEVADRLHSAAIHLLRRVRRVDDETGLSAARLSALSVVVFGGPRTLGGLARAEQVSAPTMSKLVDGLERDGLVVRTRDARDGRATLVEATEAGRRMLEQGRRRRVQELSALFADLTPEEVETLAAAAAIVEREIARPPSA